MTQLYTRYGIVKIYARTIEDGALEQVKQLADSPLGEGANLRVMPDAHAGAGCVIGTTMLVTDKVCPNLVGVDIGCGVDLVKTNLDFAARLQELDNIVRKHIPFGKRHLQKPLNYKGFAKLKCWDSLKSAAKETALKSLGTLGGGNHFIEAYANGYLAVHSGSRNIGFTIARFYQDIAERAMSKLGLGDLTIVPPQERENYIVQLKAKNANVKALSFLTGQPMQDYLHDMDIMQDFAVANRKAIMDTIVLQMGGQILSRVTSTHNYIDMRNKKIIILRKGAISAQKGEELVIPLNMRDGLLLCVGKGNEDWNFSAPHGAGRLYSRTKAKNILNLSDYKNAMKGVFSTCVNRDTLDEAPFAYKDYKEIMELVEPTVEIKERLIPIYNFKASE